MTTRRTIRSVSAVSALTTALALVAVTAPSATADSNTSQAWANDTYAVCSSSCMLGEASGGVIWGNRTSTVQGSVSSYFGYLTTVYFDAFAGPTKVDSDHRDTFGMTSYHFTIGNPDLPGGVDRIRVQVCTTFSDGTRECNPAQENLIRD
jgi:uncharacterized membrane protein